MITHLLRRIAARFDGWGDFQRLQAALRGHSFPIDVAGVSGGANSLLIWLLRRHSQRRMLIVCSSDKELHALGRDIDLYGLPYYYLPWWGVAPYGELPAHSPTYGERSRALAMLRANPQALVLTHIRALLTPVPPPDFVEQRRITLAVGDEIDVIALGRRLEAFGYSRAPRVHLHSEYALRGEVLDLMPPGEDRALRVQFEFDRIEQISEFDPDSQISTLHRSEVTIVPQREVSWEEEHIAMLGQQLGSRIAARQDSAPKRAMLNELLESLRADPKRPICAEYLPLAFGSAATLLDYLDPLDLLLYTDWERSESAAETTLTEYQAIYDAHSQGYLFPSADEACPLELLRTERHSATIRLHSLASGSIAHNLHCAPAHPFFGNIDLLKSALQDWQASGRHILIFAGSGPQAQRLGHLLIDFELEIVPYHISGGFDLPAIGLTVIHEVEIFGRRRAPPRAIHQTRRASTQPLEAFVDLNPGDPVVHINYGIGRFEGIERMRAGGHERDYLRLLYAAGDVIYLPIEQINLIQRYMGIGDGAPRLDKIGEGTWQRRKERVRKQVEELAQRLVQLYARRERVRGFAFPGDTEWQVDFEAAFPFEETADQLRSIDEIKADMERPRPMDRLLCGDVGYGKTEVALRAAFKAISAGKQVAILSPTTILAEQHYNTACERMSGFPIEIAMLSRFVKPAEQRLLLKQLGSGAIDLVVGTHRLIQRDVRFGNLGLIVVDEEQRFGVKDKELLKEFKSSIDCLTLTATPIPRTLHMSLLRIRDMSTINTPPHNRRPIETHVEPFTEERVVRAIRREIRRGGQIYYLHNRIESLQRIQSFLERLVPEALVEAAHGRMSGDELEEKMSRFVHGGFQVLLATTIIENGIDIPNVNTIIIDRADMYGISQLYQLRGRVGRSERLAYAYLFYPERNALSELAMKRLQIISDYRELGSGFKIALKDLEVRGAGNLLGREQSGNILAVGFYMYLRLLDQAIGRSEEEQLPDSELYLELEYSGFLPNDYIPEMVTKMELYKKIAAANSDERLQTLRLEIEDRFGPPPAEVSSLLAMSEIRIICSDLSISSLRERAGTVEVSFAKVADLDHNKLLALIESGRMRIDPRQPNVIRFDIEASDLPGKAHRIRDSLLQIR